MEITNVQITMLRNQKMESGNLMIGYAAITLDDSMVINSIKIIKRKDNHFIIKMPSHAIGNASRRDTCFPINRQFRKEIENKIFAELHTYI